MAELALGAISLGIQVCQGIWVYVDTLKSRQEELQAIGKQSKALHDTFQSIEATVARDGLKATANVPVENLQRCLQDCESELNALNHLWDRLTGVRLSQVNHGGGTLERLKEMARNLKYPFRRSDLIQVRDHLGRVSNTLQLAIQSTEL